MRRAVPLGDRAVAVGRGGPAAQPGPEVPGAGTHVPPTPAAIVDPFRPPANRYAPGNRGIEYATAVGTPITATADGTVVFAGQVGGTLHVTVAHAGGVRTSYSFLRRIDVVRGQAVRQGDRLGAASHRLHFGARLGDAYFDPALLFASGPVEVELVPFEVPPGSTPEAEVRALAEIALGGGGLSLNVLGDVGAWLRDRAETATHQFRQLSAERLVDLATDLTRRVLDPGPCDGREPPRRPAAARHQGTGRVAITVAGLGSSSTGGSIDELRTGELGYADDDVLRFSYAGGKVPGTGDGIEVRASDYTSADTQGDLVAAGERLADLIAEVLAAEPGATVDVFAHSQGGVVTRLALLELAERGVNLDRLGLVATLGSPHQGADLATAVVGANTHVTGNLGLDALEGAIGTGIDPDATAVSQLAETSDVIDRLRRQGVPDGVRLLSIGARADWVVAAPNTEVEDDPDDGTSATTNVTVPVTGPDAHGALVASDEATGELARAIAGRPPGCESVADAIADVVAGHGISAAEDAGGLVARSIGP